MNDYERASIMVNIYERHTEYLFKPTGVEEIDLVKKYLIHDIRLMNAIIYGYAQIENADAEVNYPLSELIKIHQYWNDIFYKTVLEENAFLSKKYSKNKHIFAKAANFYLEDVYIKYEIDKKTALEIASKITGISKEKLIEAKDKNIDPTELEKYLEFKIEYGRKTYDFNTNTIYSEMESLLKEENYDNLNIEEKINIIEKALKVYITKILYRIPGGSDFFRDFEKNLEDLIDIMAIYSNNPNNVWDVTNYLVWIIGTLKTPFNVVYSDDLILKDEPRIDTNRMIISVNKNTSPVVVFKTIYEKLFNIEYLEKSISPKIKIIVN